jgi:hypothetical protein
MNVCVHMDDLDDKNLQLVLKHGGKSPFEYVNEM